MGGQGRKTWETLQAMPILTDKSTPSWKFIRYEVSSRDAFKILRDNDPIRSIADFIHRLVRWRAALPRLSVWHPKFSIWGRNANTCILTNSRLFSWSALQANVLYLQTSRILSQLSTVCKGTICLGVKLPFIFRNWVYTSWLCADLWPKVSQKQVKKMPCKREPFLEEDQDKANTLPVNGILFFSKQRLVMRLVVGRGRICCSPGIPKSDCHLQFTDIITNIVLTTVHRSSTVQKGIYRALSWSYGW